MTNREAMNELVRFLCAGDDDMKRQLTPQMVRRMFKNMSILLFKEGWQTWRLAIEAQAPETSGRDYIAHPLLMAMYTNGKRLAKRKPRRAK